MPACSLLPAQHVHQRLINGQKNHTSLAWKDTDQTEYMLLNEQVIQIGKGKELLEQQKFLATSIHPSSNSYCTSYYVLRLCWEVEIETKRNPSRGGPGHQQW